MIFFLPRKVKNRCTLVELERAHFGNEIYLSKWIRWITSDALLYIIQGDRFVERFFFSSPPLKNKRIMMFCATLMDEVRFSRREKTIMLGWANFTEPCCNYSPPCDPASASLKNDFREEVAPSWFIILSGVPFTLDPVSSSIIRERNVSFFILFKTLYWKRGGAAATRIRVEKKSPVSVHGEEG